ncbi:DUF5979 domain-containing protein [Streptomyces sp. VRA16 Mangrove soil]|uniref:prealbumin-like fold domain-containing protein n=1 Tax=Streptomyces sp. VRA16 Mangrove soil TaxID=2817434 RepID=UPI001A9FC3AF|nr:DUF5979 domain-containing protein [Streptomyces sp. VRA16 Mangrove soil]MBO1333688.1 hypothetical protein [Streptomyces sp. VRA16 Mangrove soil]
MLWAFRSALGSRGGRVCGALLALACLLAVLGPSGGRAAAAAAAQNPLSVTFVARACPAYTDVMANKARNNIQESLRDLGPDSNYAAGEAVSAAKEAAGTPLPPCEALPGWTFATGTGITAKSTQSLNLSTVSGPIRQNITTMASTAELDNQGNPTGRTLQGAVTVNLTSQEIAAGSGLVVQGGTKSQPLNGLQEQYGFAALRCAQDSINGDNVEYVAFPSGTRHVFCYYYAITPPPDAGTIKVIKKVTPETAGEGDFRFDGNVSYADTNGDGTNDFVLHGSARQEDSITFVRGAGGAPWTFKEVIPAGTGWTPPGRPDCTVVAAGGGAGTSAVRTDSTGAVSVELAAGDTVTCTYTNTRTSGRALLEKESIGGTGTFAIDLKPPTGSGPLAIGPVTTSRESTPVIVAQAPQGATPGTYTVDEAIPASDGTGSWELVGLNCNGTDVPISKGAATDAAPRGTWHASYDVASVDDATCLLTNKFTPGGAINIEKVTDGGTGTFAYDVIAHPLSRLRDATTYRSTATTVTEGVAVTAHPEDGTGPAADELTVGDRTQYTVQEHLPPPTAAGHWELTDADCGAAGSDVDTAQGTVRVRLTAENPRPTCRFTNHFVQQGTLDVTKHTTGDTGLRPGAAHLRLSCADGTEDALDVAAGEASGALERHRFAADTTCTVRETASGAGERVDVTTSAVLTVGGRTTQVTPGEPFPVREDEAASVVVTNTFTRTPPTSSPTPTPTPTPTVTPPPTPAPSGPGTPPPGHQLAHTGTSLTALWLAAAAALAVALGTLTVTAVRRR